MRLDRRLTTGVVCCALVLAAGAGLVRADISETVFLFEARNGDGSGTIKVLFEEGTWDEQRQRFSWDLQGPVTLINPMTEIPIATLKSAKVRLYLGSNPRINLDFAVEAGRFTTSFVVTPGQVSFNTPVGYHVQGSARAAVAIADQNNNGVTLKALGKYGNGVFLGQYNGFVPYGIDFTQLIGSISAGPGGAASVSQNDPPSGYRAIDGDVTDISCQVRFWLTPKDTAESTTRYGVTFYTSEPLP